MYFPRQEEPTEFELDATAGKASWTLSDYMAPVSELFSVLRLLHIR
jgi:hypothetical protein